MKGAAGIRSQNRRLSVTIQVSIHAMLKIGAMTSALLVNLSSVGPYNLLLSKTLYGKVFPVPGKVLGRFVLVTLKLV